MTLSEAIQSFEDNFEYVAYLQKLDEDPKLPLVCSGGVLEDVLGVLPALYSSEELAAEAWSWTCHSMVEGSENVLEWHYYPELVEFQMTMADRNGAHRLVTKRYAVKSQFKVEYQIGICLRMKRMDQDFSSLKSD